MTWTDCPITNANLKVTTIVTLAEQLSKKHFKIE